MRIRHWLSELRHGCSRVVRRTGRTHLNRRPRVADRTLLAAVATPTAALESRILLAAPNPFQLSSLLPTNGGNGMAGFTLDGGAANEIAGWSSVSAAGDINGDGLDDLLIGAIGADPNTGVDAGVTYLVFGTIEGTRSSLNLSTLNGTTGYVFQGMAAGDQCGSSVSGAGDVNGDGFADLLIGARFASPNGTKSGQTYLVFGGPTNLAVLDAANGEAVDGRIKLSALDGTTGFFP